MKFKNLLATSVILVTGVNGASAANIFAGNEYLLSSSTTWAAAEIQANALGGNLVAINSAAEQAALIGFFGGTQQFWIGLNDFASEGTFVWSNGDPVGFTNWRPGEPNDFSPGEDGVVMNWGVPGGWNDLFETESRVGIIELEAPGRTSPTSPIPEPSGAPIFFLLGAALMGFRQRR